MLVFYILNAAMKNSAI